MLVVTKAGSKWKWAKDVIRHGGNDYHLFNTYWTQRNGQSAARRIEANGYKAVLSYWGKGLGWQLHSTYQFNKKTNPLKYLVNRWYDMPKNPAKSGEVGPPRITGKRTSITGRRNIRITPKTPRLR